MSTPASPKESSAKPINLALQGGGAHGAYTWGVLDRLLDAEDLVVEGISGTSAGAMNGAVFLSGYAKGGREGARTALRQFWKRISEMGQFSPLQYVPFGHLTPNYNLDWSWGYRFFDVLSRVLSPYDTNPFNLNPLREVLNEMVDFKALQNCQNMKLFIAATSVHSGQARIFREHELTADALLASACLPYLFQAVTIKDEAFWDGGYMGNPAIWPLIYSTETRDILLVQINPLHVNAIPKKASEIIDRMSEITFNSSLIAEMRAIAFVSRLVEDNMLDEKKYKRVLMHMIETPQAMHKLNASSKLNASWDFFEYLFAEGRKSADAWLKQHQADIGQRQTLDITHAFLDKKRHLREAAE